MTVKTDKLDAQIEKLYYKHCAGTTINIMDIGKLYEARRVAYAGGLDMDATMIEQIAKYNQS